MSDFIYDKPAHGDVLKPAGYKTHTISLLLSSLAISMLSLALPIMTLQVYDRILPNPGTGTLVVLVTAVCVAVLLEALLRICRSYVIGRAGASYEHRVACNAMSVVLNANIAQMGRHGVGEHLHRMSAVSKVKDFYNGYALCVIAELAFVPIFLGLIIYIAHMLALVPVAILTIFICVSLLKGMKLRRALKNREMADDERFNFLIEALEGVHSVKAFALEKFFERRYESLEEHSSVENYKVTQIAANTFNFAAIVSHFMVAAVITVGAWFVLHGALSTGALIATLLLSGRMMQPVQKALALWTRYQDYVLAREHLEDLFATPQYKVDGDKALSAQIAPTGQLSMRDVSFYHKDDPRGFLKDIHLDMKRGETILIQGGHGCGKTTLLELIAGIYPVTSGRIEIDDVAINCFAPEDLVKHVGLIRTSTLTFRGTIRDNITCFGQIDEKQAREIASILEVDKDVAQLPGGFDTFLSGNGTDTISPGLEKRIAMVRVLAAKPRLILFDNADRSLDKEGYSLIYSLLAQLKGKASMILISDDLNIQYLADRRFTLADGHLHETLDATAHGNIRPYKELRI